VRVEHNDQNIPAFVMSESAKLAVSLASRKDHVAQGDLGRTLNAPLDLDTTNPSPPRVVGASNNGMGTSKVSGASSGLIHSLVHTLPFIQSQRGCYPSFSPHGRLRTPTLRRVMFRARTHCETTLNVTVNVDRAVTGR